LRLGKGGVARGRARSLAHVGGVMQDAHEVQARAEADPRLLRLQAERAAEAIRNTIIPSLAWAAAVAAICSDLVGLFGHVPYPRALAFVAVVAAASLGARIALARFDAVQRRLTSPGESVRWFRRFLAVQLFTSIAWGFGPWLLWDVGDSVNHVFLGIATLSVIARFLTNRASNFEFFVASVVPVAVLLFTRYLTTFDGMEMTLAIIVAGYAIQILLDGHQVSKRMEQDTQLGFANEDMAREIEEARDEALKKRFEAEAANASKTAFLANMSHELRTPLNAILGFSEIIARECLGPVGSPRYKEYAADIHNSGAHLLSLINDLLDVAKIEAGRMEIEPVEIETQKTLEGALKFVGVRARERNQRLTIEISPAAATIFADERALKQIVINLVSNSVKFTPPGGRIDVTARANASGDFELMVQDNGPGIPREKVDRIFQPFSQLDNRYDRQAGGTGLGLALVRGLANLHGGRAWIESEEGQGTRVFVVLPGVPAAVRVKA
jgi:two-component system cell cycle sensor histidine kinase PleC